jgi:hypothetical protein
MAGMPGCSRLSTQSLCLCKSKNDCPLRTSNELVAEPAWRCDIGAKPEKFALKPHKTVTHLPMADFVFGFTLNKTVENELYDTPKHTAHRLIAPD